LWIHQLSLGKTRINSWAPLIFKPRKTLQLLIPIKLLLTSNQRISFFFLWKYKITHFLSLFFSHIEITKLTITALRLQIQVFNLNSNHKYPIKMIVDKMVCQEQALAGTKVLNNYLILMVLVFLDKILNPSSNPYNLQLDLNKKTSGKLTVAEIVFGWHIMLIILQNTV